MPAVKPRTAATKNNATKQALAEALKKFREWLDKLPKEVAADLEELFKLHASTEDAKEKAEIAETINELLVPGVVLVQMEDCFSLSDEDEAVRKRLTSYRKKVGKEIKKHRIAKDLSQDELAELAGIPQSHVSRLERGVHVPTQMTIERIANALEICPSKLDPGFESKAELN